MTISAVEDDMNAPAETSRTGRTTRRVLLAALAVLPLAILADVLRPAIFEQRLFEQVSIMRGEPEPALTLTDLAVLAVCSLALIVAPWLLRRVSTKTLAGLVLAAWTSVLALASAEAVLRFGGPRVYQPGIVMRFEPDRNIMPGIDGPTTFSTNKLGMRGPDWSDGDYKILAVGGSTTIGLYLDDAKAWPQRMMTILNEKQRQRRYWVGNVGKSGLDSLHHLELLKRLAAIEEVDCVLIMCGVNDLNHALRMPDETRRRLAPSHVFDRGGPFDPMLPYLETDLPVSHGEGTPPIDCRGGRRGCRDPDRRDLRQSAPRPTGRCKGLPPAAARSASVDVRQQSREHAGVVSRPAHPLCADHATDHVAGADAARARSVDVVRADWIDTSHDQLADSCPRHGGLQRDDARGLPAGPGRVHRRGFGCAEDRADVL